MDPMDAKDDRATLKRLQEIPNVGPETGDDRPSQAFSRERLGQRERLGRGG